MATKSQIEAAITARTTGSATVMTWEKHAEMLKTEDTSFLENIYPTVIVDGNFSGGTETITSGDAAKFKYVQKITKQGRNVTLIGSFVVQTTQSGGSTIFEIDVPEYFQNTDSYIFTAFKSDGDSIQMRLLGNLMTIMSTAITNETFRYQIIYNTLN